jgi:epoxyqueuosine reductase
MAASDTALDYHQAADLLKRWAGELGFADIAVTDTDLSAYTGPHRRAIEQGLHGEMGYLERNQHLRYEPAQLHPGTRRVICARMDYLPETVSTVDRLATGDKAYIARYALGRDYHKFMRKRLTQLARRLEAHIGPYGYRAFVDSAPVLERQLAEKSGLGWIGKNPLVLNKEAGSWFLLGEIFTDLPLPVDQPTDKEHFGSCTACPDVCPTRAFVKPWLLDARRRMSYLTIEYKGSIPLEFRPLIGNRVFGCDDCQIFCPWTKFSQRTEEKDFQPRHAFDAAELAGLFLWDEATFLEKTAGSPIRRTGYECWLRNLAVGLGNAPTTDKVINALEQRLDHPSELVREHTQWAMDRHLNENHGEHRGHGD